MAYKMENWKKKLNREKNAENRKYAKADFFLYFHGKSINYYLIILKDLRRLQSIKCMERRRPHPHPHSHPHQTQNRFSLYLLVRGARFSQRIYKFISGQYFFLCRAMTIPYSWCPLTSPYPLGKHHHCYLTRRADKSFLCTLCVYIKEDNHRLLRYIRINLKRELFKSLKQRREKRNCLRVRLNEIE